MIKRGAVGLLLLVGLVTGATMLATAAWAVQPVPPEVTTGLDMVVELSDQPIHFEGTVPGPVSAFDKVFVSNFTANPGDPPIICQDDALDPVGPGPSAWSCDTINPIPVGDWEIRVSWFAMDPMYMESSPPKVVTLHVIPDAVVEPPAPPKKPKPKPEPEPEVVLVPTPTPTPEPTPTPTPTPEPSPEPTPVPQPTPAPEPVAPESELPPPWDPTDHPKEVVTIGVAAFTMLTLVGPAGLAASSMLGAVGVAVAAGAAAAEGSRKAGSVKAAKVKMTKFKVDGAGRGDNSGTWKLPGWRQVDAFSLAAPAWLATRSPLTARVLADGSYLRAIFSSAWTLLVLAGGALGVVAAHQTDGIPIAPSVALTTTLLVIAIFDATAGFAGVIGFLIGMMIWGSNQLGTAATIRSFLGLAALWFAIPLIAAATRPFRRTLGEGRPYAWDRIADAVIGTLMAGWAVQKTIGGLPGLSGLDLPIADSADQIALVAIIACVARVLIEELAAWRYPQRLIAVEKGKLPFAGPGQRLWATALRTGLFVFLSIAFIGNCWQLWVGAALFCVPQILSIYERKFPNSERLHGLLPSGLFKVLLMMVVGTLFAKLVFSMLDDPDSIMRNAFILLTIPGLVLSLLGLFGHDGPDPKWTWPKQFLGVGILGGILYLVFTGF